MFILWRLWKILRWNLFYLRLCHICNTCNITVVWCNERNFLFFFRQNILNFKTDLFFIFLLLLFLLLQACTCAVVATTVGCRQRGASPARSLHTENDSRSTTTMPDTAAPTTTRSTPGWKPGSTNIPISSKTIFSGTWRNVATSRGGESQCVPVATPRSGTIRGGFRLRSRLINWMWIHPSCCAFSGSASPETV